MIAGKEGANRASKRGVRKVDHCFYEFVCDSHFICFFKVV